MKTISYEGFTKIEDIERINKLNINLIDLDYKIKCWYYLKSDEPKCFKKLLRYLRSL